MIVCNCNCTLGGTKACFSCPNRLENFDIFEDYRSKKVKTIEEFDKDGNLIKRTTEEI